MNWFTVLILVLFLSSCLCTGCGGGKVSGPEDAIADGRHSPGFPCAASSSRGPGWAIRSECEK